MVPRDTHAEAHAVQLRAYRAMAPEQRAQIALELSDDMRSIAREGIRMRHPEYSQEQIRRALVRLLHGAEAARRIWPDDGSPPP